MSKASSLGTRPTFGVQGLRGVQACVLLQAGVQRPRASTRLYCTAILASYQAASTQTAAWNANVKLSPRCLSHLQPSMTLRRQLAPRAGCTAALPSRTREGVPAVAVTGNRHACAPIRRHCCAGSNARARVQAQGALGKVNRAVLAYSGGLDTSVILKWLQEEYGCEVITFTADLGQVRAAGAMQPVRLHGCGCSARAQTTVCSASQRNR